MSAHISRDRQSFGFDLYEWLMLLVSVATVLAFFAIWRDRVAPIRTFADNIYDDPCDSVFVENASWTNFLIRGSISPSDD